MLLDPFHINEWIETSASLQILLLITDRYSLIGEALSIDLVELFLYSLYIIDLLIVINNTIIPSISLLETFITVNIFLQLSRSVFTFPLYKTNSTLRLSSAHFLVLDPLVAQLLLSSALVVIAFVNPFS